MNSGHGGGGGGGGGGMRMDDEEEDGTALAKQQRGDEATKMLESYVIGMITNHKQLPLVRSLPRLSFLPLPAPPFSLSSPPPPPPPALFSCCSCLAVLF